VQSEYFKPGKFRGVHKVYNYWFTGQNTQVLQYEQHLNKLWTQVIGATGLPQTIQQQVSSREQWKKHVFPNSNQSNQGAEGKTFEPGANAADYLYSADQAEIKLSILGDPAWIPNPQLGYINPTTFNAAPFFPDGTINTSASGAYFEFAWNRPVDYNLQTGLMDPGQNNYFADRESGVAGIATEAVTYMANRVTSTFKNGKFSQELYGKWLADTRTTTTTTPAAAGRPATTPTDTQARDSNQSSAETQRLLNANNKTPPVGSPGQIYAAEQKALRAAADAKRFGTRPLNPDLTNAPIPPPGTPVANPPLFPQSQRSRGYLNPDTGQVKNREP
jgi:hypothetical protein